MDWAGAISQGTGWILAMAIGYAVLTGRLRLEREVIDRDAQIKALSTQLQSVSEKAEEALMSEQSTVHEELKEMRRTNSELVAVLSGRRS